MLFLGSETRTRVYVGGFTLYYEALKGTRFKWVDPVRLAALLLPREHAIFHAMRVPRHLAIRVCGVSQVSTSAPFSPSSTVLEMK